MTAFTAIHFEEAKSTPLIWGRFFESCVGAKLLNETRNTNLKIFYWREKNNEVDFVLTSPQQIIAIEIKSGQKRKSLPGLNFFAKNNPACKKLLIGQEGILLEEFLLTPVKNLFNKDFI